MLPLHVRSDQPYTYLTCNDYLHPLVHDDGHHFLFAFMALIFIAPTFIIFAFVVPASLYIVLYIHVVTLTIFGLSRLPSFVRIIFTGVIQINVLY